MKKAMWSLLAALSFSVPVYAHVHDQAYEEAQLAVITAAVKNMSPEQKKIMLERALQFRDEIKGMTVEQFKEYLQTKTESGGIPNELLAILRNVNHQQLEAALAEMMENTERLIKVLQTNR